MSLSTPIGIIGILSGAIVDNSGTIQTAAGAVADNLSFRFGAHNYAYLDSVESGITLNGSAIDWESATARESDIVISNGAFAYLSGGTMTSVALLKGGQLLNSTSQRRLVVELL